MNRSIIDSEAVGGVIGLIGCALSNAVDRLEWAGSDWDLAIQETRGALLSPPPPVWW